MHLFSTRITLRPVALASLLALGACSKNNNSTPTPAATTYATTWTADSKNYTATASTTQVSNNMLSVLGAQVDGNKDSYAATFSVPAAVGTYSLTSGSNGGGYTTTVGGVTTSYGVAPGYGGSGTVTVSTLSATEAIGTFSFATLNATTGGTAAGVTISNGKFAIKR